MIQGEWIETGVINQAMRQKQYLSLMIQGEWIETLTQLPRLHWSHGSLSDDTGRVD